MGGCAYLCGANSSLWYKKTMYTEQLRKEVERITGRCMQSHQDFAWLSEQIADRSRYLVSVNTLKRLWGYFESDARKTRRSTLDTLSQFVGFRDYASFCHQQESMGVESNPVLSRHLDARRLPCGLKLRFTWLPDRVMVAEHLGKGHFVVRSVERSKLSVGDTFECGLILENEPLYLCNLSHDGMGPVAYVAGKQDGVRFEVLED